MRRLTIRIDEDDQPSVEWVFPNVNPATMRFDLRSQYTEPVEEQIMIGGLEGRTIVPSVVVGATLDMHLDCRAEQTMRAGIYSWQVVQ